MAREIRFAWAMLLIGIIGLSSVLAQDVDNTNNIITAQNAAELVELYVLEGHRDRINSLAFSPVKPILVTGADDETVRLWDLSTGDEITILEGHSDSVEVVAFSTDGTMVASGGQDDKIILWDVNTATQITELNGHRNQVRGLAFSPAGHVLASASTDGTIILWDLDDYGIISTINVVAGVWTVAYDANGAKLATGVFSDVRIFDPETGVLIETLSGHDNDVRNVRFSPDGAFLASGADFGNLILWDIEIGEMLFTFDETITVDGITFSPDGQLIVIADGLKAQIVYIENGKSVVLLRVSSDSVRSVDFSSAGDMIAATSGNIVHVWALPEAAG